MSRDPYQYFRIEAREILEGLGRGVLEMEKPGAPRDLIGRLLRLAHTLKGAARVVRQPAIAETAHAVEGALVPHREAQGPLPRESIDQMLRLLDMITAQVAALDAKPDDGPDTRPDTGPDPGAATKVPPRPAAEEPFETVRVEIGEMDALLRVVAETAVQLSALQKEIGTIEQIMYLGSVLLEQFSPRRAAEPAAATAGRARSLAEDLHGSLEKLQRNLAVGIERTERELIQVRDTADRLRLLPISAVFASLERAARDVAHSLDRRISFHASGGDSRLDAQVLYALQDALLHVVRNAVAHGIEPEAQRAAAGKPPEGRVEICVERRGNRVAFVCRDDGRGIDVEAVRSVALGRGLITEAQAGSLDPEQVARLILLAGVTTTDVVTQVSGRGIGLDVVRDTATRMGGAVTVQTQRGRGTTIEVCVPVSFSALEALMVDAAGVTAALPFFAVCRTMRVLAGDIAYAAGGDSILHEGRAIPFLPLARALRRPVPPGRRPWSVVVVSSGAAQAALGVDRLLGAATVAARRLLSLALADPIVAAVALDVKGGPQLVLDPRAIVEAAHAAPGPVSDAAVPSPRPVLVIDDSLTTRMLEQSILQSAGYQVEMATSAEEALDRARDRRYSLFIVDVEMPGMDGFEFLVRARTDAALREVPAILVTSRNSAADRRRGEQAGARAYIVKSEFDQGSFLRTIRELIG